MWHAWCKVGAKRHCDRFWFRKAKEIQWQKPEDFEDMVIWLGGFHIAFNCLSLLGKKYDGSGKEDILIEAGVYCSATASMLLKGKGYNRGVQASKLLMKAFLHLQLSICSVVIRPWWLWCWPGCISTRYQDCQIALEKEQNVQEKAGKLIWEISADVSKCLPQSCKLGTAEMETFEQEK